MQILLVSKWYILVVNFGKNVQQGGEGGGSSPIQKISLQISIVVVIVIVIIIVEHMARSVGKFPNNLLLPVISFQSGASPVLQPGRDPEQTACNKKDKMQNLQICNNPYLRSEKMQKVLT